MRLTLLGCALLLFALPVFGNGALLIEDALRKAKQEKKNIVVKYEANWSKKCNYVNTAVVANPYIQSVLETDYILVIADIDDPIAKSWFIKYQINEFPTVHILNFQGEVIFRSKGAITEEQLYTALLDHSINIDDGLYLAENTVEETDKKVAQSAQPRVVLASTQSSVQEDIHKFTVTVGAFSVYENAERCIHRLQTIYPGEYFIEEDQARNLFRVNIGRYQIRGECSKVIAQLKQDQIDCYIRSI